MSLNYSHLLALSDDVGIFEHAKYNKARIEHGYCVDDVARALILIERNQPDSGTIQNQRLTYLQFIREAQTDTGEFINRKDVSGVWNGPAEIADHWGRALWALGTTFRYEQDRDLAYEALQRFELGARNRSEFMRSMLFASLGAAEVLDVDAKNRFALSLLDETAQRIESVADESEQKNGWLWPEKRLTYANAALPEVLMLAGVRLNNRDYLVRGIVLLKWLLSMESKAPHFSVTPVGGRSAYEMPTDFDQQPIEVAALVDACSTAYKATNDSQWLAYIARGARWFAGSNDARIPMHDPMTGAGFDGMTKDGRNHNCGAESTIAYLSVMDQYERHFAGANDTR